jgi:hypothetical protein
VVLASPIIWYAASLFDHPLSIDAVERLMFAMPIAYLLGTPAALLTGLAYAAIQKCVKALRAQRISVVVVGAFSSTYLVWLALLDRIGETTYNLSWVPSVIFLMIIGALSTTGLLIMERRRTKRAHRRTSEVIDKNAA